MFVRYQRLEVLNVYSRGPVLVKMYSRRMAKPIPVPRAIGRRIEAAGWANTWLGRVIEGK